MRRSEAKEGSIGGGRRKEMVGGERKEGEEGWLLGEMNGWKRIGDA